MILLMGDRMVQKEKLIYQFKIVMHDIQPEIWRRIQVRSSYSFWDLHVAIQDAMGWEDYHLHEFIFNDPKTKQKLFIGIPDEDDWGDKVVLAGWDLKISDYFSLETPEAQYDYDFGDGWEHTIILEKILPAEPRQKYPKCLDGKRACPPEDCGGIYGYESLNLILQTPNHPEYKEKIRWLGGKFDPEKFNPEKVKFDNPDKRWKIAFEDPIEF